MRASDRVLREEVDRVFFWEEAHDDPWAVEFHAAGIRNGEERWMDGLGLQVVRVDARPCDPLPASVQGLCADAVPELSPELWKHDVPPLLVVSVDGIQYDPFWGLTVAAAVGLVRLGGNVVLVWRDQSLTEENDGSSPEVEGKFAAGEYHQGVSVAHVLAVIAMAAARTGREIGAVEVDYYEHVPGLVSLCVQVVAARSRS